MSLSLLTPPWASEGEARPPGFWKFHQIRFFSWFWMGKTNFTTFDPPWKILEKSPGGPPLENILPTPMNSTQLNLKWTWTINNCVCGRDDHGAGVSEWTPAGVCILGRSRRRSQYFRFEPEQDPEPESTLRSVQEPIKILKGPNFWNDACCQIEWN